MEYQNKIHDGAFCEECGKPATMAEYSKGECSKCLGEIKDESELMEEEEIENFYF